MELIDKHKILTQKYWEKSLKEWVKEDQYDKLMIYEIFNMIDDEEPIEAEPVVHAHWEDVEAYQRCSACGKLSMCGGYYCDNCGAKMDEKEKNQ